MISHLLTSHFAFVLEAATSEVVQSTTVSFVFYPDFLFVVVVVVVRLRRAVCAIVERLVS